MITYKAKGGIIEVVRWFRYPRYDFIFGVPEKNHSLRKDEAGFFLIRNRKNRKRASITGGYLDRQELKEFMEGFRAIVRRGK